MCCISIWEESEWLHDLLYRGSWSDSFGSRLTADCFETASLHCDVHCLLSIQVLVGVGSMSRAIANVALTRLPQKVRYTNLTMMTSRRLHIYIYTIFASLNGKSPNCYQNCNLLKQVKLRDCRILVDDPVFPRIEMFPNHMYVVLHTPCIRIICGEMNGLRADKCNGNRECHQASGGAVHRSEAYLNYTVQ